MKLLYSIEVEFFDEHEDRWLEVEETTAIQGEVYPEESFLDYLEESDFPFRCLKEHLKGGELTIRHEDSRSFACVEYESNRPLSEEECVALRSYTRGQLTDGIGENFVCMFADRTGILPSFLFENELREEVILGQTHPSF